MKRKILSLIFVFAMTVSLFTVGAGAAEPIYRDTDGHWAAETIEGFSRLGLIEGYNGQFFPNKNITRGEMAVILDRLMDYQTAAKNSFSDLGEAFYTDAVLKANAVGVMLGSNGTVRPTDPITRQEAAVLLCRALGLEGGGSVAQFSDRGQIASWAADAVGAMAAKKLLQGANGMFRPTDAITRAETVAILDRALGKLVSEGESASGRVDGNVVVRGAGAKLSDMTINGDLIIAEGVGVGEVHLDGVTITGRTIVRGGGVNSIYMNNVRANGGVVVNKLDGRVRVVTSGNTTVSVTLLQSGAILVGDGFKTVEIPADIAKGQTVEIQGNIERLVNNSEDAKITANGTIQTVEANVKTEIKGDVKVVGATGSADVKVNGSAVAKTDKPAAGGSSGGNSGSGGSSGSNSSTTSKEIVGAEKVTLDVPYGEKTADEALAAIPKNVTLNLKDGKTISATVTEWKWASGVNYDSKPTADTPLTAEGSFTVPSGYTYSGSTTVQATVTVKALDETKLKAAKKAYADLQGKQIFDEKEAAMDKEKILIKDSTPDQITAGVRFATPKDWQPLDDAIKSVGNQEKVGFASQKECNETADILQAAIDEFIQKKVKVGTNTTTDAYILQQVKEYPLNPDRGRYAYSSDMQPLKSGYAYWLYINNGWSVPNSSVNVSIEWSVSGSNNADVTDIVKIGDVPSGKNDGLEYHSYGAMIQKTPTEPTKVTFTATVKNSQTNDVIGTLDYPATIGVPISTDPNGSAPQFTAINGAYTTSATNFKCVVQIPLYGAEAIKSVSDGCVTMDAQSTASDPTKVSFDLISVDQVEKSDTGLNVTVSVITGSIGGVWNENSPYPFKEGILPNISIDTSKFVLKTMEEGNPGWYLPSGALNPGDMPVKLLTPAFTKVEQDTNDPQTFTIHTRSMPENAKVEVALAKIGVTDIDNATIKKDATRGDDGKYSVTFDKNQFDSNATYYLWFRYGSPGSDWAYENENNRPTYTFNNTTSGGGESGGNTTEGSQAGA